MKLLARIVLLLLLVATSVSTTTSATVGLLQFGSQQAPFGVNLSGPEFAPWNGQTFPSVADWDYLQSKGVKLVRLPVAWESLQPTLSAALNSTYLTSIQTALSRAAARNIGVIVDVHNFAHYCDQSHWVSSGCGYAGNAAVAGTGVSVLGDATLTSAAFVDLWTRLSTSLKGTTGLVGYGIMNEPQSIVGPTNLINAPNYYGQSSGPQSWFAINGSAATQLANGTNPLGASYGPAWTITGGSAFGAFCQSGISLSATSYTISVYVKVSAGTQTGFIQIASGLSGSFTATTSWTRVTFTGTPSAGSATACLGVNTAAAVVQFSNAQLELGASATTYVPNQYLSYAQAVITAIRVIDANTPIYVNGYLSSAAYSWQAYNYELAQLTGGNLIFETHQYFDGPQGVGGGGVYSGDYSSYSITTASGQLSLVSFLQWLTDQSKKGYIGEFGVPNSATDANPQWLILQSLFLQTAWQNRLTATMWFYGSNGVQPGNNLNVVPVLGVDDPRLTQMLAIP